ncbi:hypothetical protein QUA43_27830 [Microcoleus sp. N9_B4]
MNFLLPPLLIRGELGWVKNLRLLQGVLYGVICTRFHYMVIPHIYTLIMQHPNLLGSSRAIALHSVLPDFTGNCGAIVLLTGMFSRLIFKKC